MPSGSDYSADELHDARRPIASLMSKSEKAQQKLVPGTWQHTMLDDNLRALRIASALMDEEAPGHGGFAPTDLREGLAALASMVTRTEKAFGTFAPKTSQHTLQKNRLKALRIAEALLREELAAVE